MLAAGTYEPASKQAIAVEPSASMNVLDDFSAAFLAWRLYTMMAAADITETLHAAGLSSKETWGCHSNSTNPNAGPKSFVR